MKKLLLISSITLLTHSINAQCFPAINNETVTVSQNTICSGKSATITTGSSVGSIKYYLRDNATNTVIVGPINGTGGALSFNTGSLTSTKTFNVYSETLPGGNIALNFDGSDDVIYTNVYSTATNSLTLEAWIYPSANTYKRIISNHDGTANPGEFALDTSSPINNGRGLRFYVVGPSSVSHSVTISNVLTLNTWNHVASTFDNGVMKLYVNGLAVITSTAPFTSLPSSANQITIGEDPLIVVPEYFNGKMDDIRIWTTARTATEISSNMNNCLVGNELGLKNYFKLFENSGTTTTDAVTNSIGTLSGMTSATAWTAGNVSCGTVTCSLQMTNTITVNVAPIPTISVNSGTICSGSSFTITPSGANTYTIQGGSAIKTPTANASYTVVGTSAAGCVSSTFATSSVNVVICTGITESTHTNIEASVFPNPSSTNLTVKTDETIETVTIYNLLGAVILEEKNNSFSVEKLPAGVYTIQIKTVNGSGTVRFIKE